MVFYFTGTGNSLYIAKQIEKEPVSIPQVMRQEHLEYRADAIGIVAPVYGHEVPAMVRDFLRAVRNQDHAGVRRRNCKLDLPAAGNGR